MVAPLILIVEDDPAASDIFSTFLTYHGYRVQQAPNGQEGLRLIRELIPAVVLMDLSMPVVDGWEAMRGLKEEEHTARIPIVALTAHSMVGDRQKTLDAGFDSYLSKPVGPREVLAEVQRLIRLATD